MLEIDDKIFKQLLVYNTARIDIINTGNMNTIEIIDLSDDQSKVYEPTWIDKTEGYGKIVESSTNSIHIKFKCISGGILRIFLRSKNRSDKNNIKFPVYIDYTKFKVNNNDILNNNYLVWHDKPYEFKKQVKNDEIVDICVEWSPFNKSSSINSNFVKNIYNSQVDYNSDLEEKIKQIESNQNRLKDEFVKNIDSINFLFNTLFIDYELTKPKKLLNNMQMLTNELLDFISNVCNKFNLTWWLDYGNLLGAVRHGNYVPWDDDADIGMIRKDYIKFEKIFQNEIEINNLTDYVKLSNASRRIDGKTVEVFDTVRLYYEMPNFKYKQIISNVDIFPYDFLNKYDEVGFDELCLNSRNNLYRNKIQKISQEEYLNQYYEELNLNFNQTKYIMPGVEGVCGIGYVYKMFVLESEKIFPLNEIKFGNKIFPCPNDTHYYLNKIYGNYMEIPKKLHKHVRLSKFRYNSNNDELFEKCIDLLKEVNEKY